MVQFNNSRKMRSPGKAKNLKGKQKQRKSFVKKYWSTRASANKGGAGSWFGALGLTKNNLLFQKWKLWRKSWCLVLVAWRCTLWCLLFPSNMALMFILCTNYWHITFSLAFFRLPYLFFFWSGWLLKFHFLNIIFILLYLFPLILFTLTFHAHNNFSTHKSCFCNILTNFKKYLFTSFCARSKMGLTTAKSAA